MTCQLGYDRRPCVFQGQRAHYFITLYIDSHQQWSVRTEYHSPNGQRGRQRINSSAKHFESYDQARTFAIKKHAQWSAFPNGIPVVVELGEALR